MTYRGYELEQKKLMVGWQITITKDDKFGPQRKSGAAIDRRDGRGAEVRDGVIAESDICACVAANS